ncbi:Flp family type IVb pilin [Georgenia thermotolerans]|uniref:Flp family type IVb pilin n=1 Tax=Georgenia thermotolerans TaxID=527326 RepID=A0A7J5UTE3_9MICO|nr:Flp family type IVb pilin [Georgenia thermotolerans]KAE8765549.1 Flp family type IVb pilin [Georgenia thermotolerans]
MNRAAAYLMTMFTVIGDRFENRKDRGATAVEYGLMVGLIAVAIIVVVALLGRQLDALFDKVAAELAGPSGVAVPAP